LAPGGPAMKQAGTYAHGRGRSAHRNDGGAKAPAGGGTRQGVRPRVPGACHKPATPHFGQAAPANRVMVSGFFGGRNSIRNCSESLAPHAMKVAQAAWDGSCVRLAFGRSRVPPTGSLGAGRSTVSGRAGEDGRCAGKLVQTGRSGPVTTVSLPCSIGTSPRSQSNNPGYNADAVRLEGGPPHGARAHKNLDNGLASAC